MKKIVFLFVLLFLNCSYHRAIVVNKVNNRDKIDPKNNGYIFFKAFGKQVDADILIEVKNTTSNHTYRIDGHPNTIKVDALFGFYKAYRNEGDSLPEYLILAQLPQGQYVFKKLWFNYPDLSTNLKETEFQVENGKIYYLGNYEFEVKMTPVINTIKNPIINMSFDLEAAKKSLESLNDDKVSGLELISSATKIENE